MIRSTVPCVMLCCLLAAAHAMAEEAVGDLRPSVPADFKPAAHGLAATPLTVEALGLAMYRPAQAFVAADRAGGQLVVSIHDDSDLAAWSVSIQHMAVARGSTPQQHVQQHLAGLREAGREFRLIDDADFTAGGIDGRLTYVEQQAHDERVVAGWLILPVADDIFLVFSVLSVAEEFPLIRSAIEKSFSTINLRSAAEVSLQRRSRIESGRQLLDSLTPEKLRSLVGLAQWSRIYRPDGEGGETEIGYSLLEVYEAKRGELNPERPESQYSPKERVDGIMVRLQGRVIGDAQRNIFYDSIALYWMAWDQSEEAWSVRGTQRQGQAERSESETGLRTAASVGNPRPLLTVIRQRSADYQRDPHEWSVPDVYLSQALGAVLGRLMPRDDGRSREFSYYFYNYSLNTPQLTQRLDRWEPAEDGSGNWTLTSQLSVDSPPVISTYSPDGEFIRTRRFDGMVTVPTTPDRLRQIWQSKGLPMDTAPPAAPPRSRRQR